jgi:hypothetical protein
MKHFFSGAVFVIILFSINVNAQADHKWKPLIVNDIKKIWYDKTNIDSIKGDRFEIWLLQMHIPPVNINGSSAKAFRTMTLYAVDLSTVKYGIEEITYLDENAKEICSYNYMIRDYEDNLKYTYPVMENSAIHLVIKELFKNSSEQKK